MVINYYNGDIMTSSLTLPGSGFHLPRRKHSLHDVLDWDRPEPGPQSDNMQRIVDTVKKPGIIYQHFSLRVALIPILYVIKDSVVPSLQLPASFSFRFFQSNHTYFISFQLLHFLFAILNAALGACHQGYVIV